MAKTTKQLESELKSLRKQEQTLKEIASKEEERRAVKRRIRNLKFRGLIRVSKAVGRAASLPLKQIKISKETPIPKTKTIKVKVPISKKGKKGKRKFIIKKVKIRTMKEPIPKRDGGNVLDFISRI